MRIERSPHDNNKQKGVHKKEEGPHANSIGDKMFGQGMWKVGIVGIKKKVDIKKHRPYLTVGFICHGWENRSIQLLHFHGWIRSSLL